MVDYLIVGQGLAGTLLANLLLEKGKTVKVLDIGHDTAASNVAAGAINPVTGRRIVKSWRIDDFLPEALAQYKDLEQKLGVTLYHQRNLNWVFASAKEENEWNLRCNLPTIKDYIVQNNAPSEWLPFVKNAFGFGEVTHTAQVDLPLLIASFRNFLIKKNDFIEVKTLEDWVKYKEIASKIIFCEGEKARFNPYWNWLPFVVAKGEVLLIVFDAPYQFSTILKDNISIIPLKNNRYWVGSNYEWTPPDAKPTAFGKQYLQTALDELLNIPYKILAHQAAIRPSTKDRRPFLGQHPEYTNYYIFNGLGTKGASLAPYWVKHLVDFLEENKILDKEVDIKRTVVK